MAAPLVGIDLGTTYCAIATLDDHGQPYTVPNGDNEMLTPSAVLLLDDGTAVVGQAALDVALEQPDRVATIIKRKMGEASFGRPVAGRDFRPETLSAIILRKLVMDAEARLGPIKKAVITVPAYFDEARRKATKDAGRIAGIDVLDILDEPTAAAIAYSLQSPKPGMTAPGQTPMLPDEERTVLVYDLGGGTFDVSLVKLSKQFFQGIAVEGDAQLGGKDWDDRIIDYVAAEFSKANGTDPRQDPVAHTALRAAAERAKRTLSKLPQTTVSCSAGGKTMSVPLSRAKFEELTRDLLIRTRMTVSQVLRHSGLTWDAVDRVLMVGGSTHMPMTANMLRDLTGKAPDTSLAVSEVVARGAALHAGIVAAHAPSEEELLDEATRALLEQIVEVNVNAHAVGVEVKDREGKRVNYVLIPRNTQLPHAASRVFYTGVPNQQKVKVRILQGDAPTAEACKGIGEVWIDGLTPDLPVKSPIQVRCGLAADGMIEVMALDMTGGVNAHAVIHRSSGLTEEQIEAEAAFVRGLKIQ